MPAVSAIPKKSKWPLETNRQCLLWQVHNAACYSMLHWWTKVDQGHEEFLRPNPLGLVVQDLVPKPGPKRVSRTLKSTRIKAMTMMTMSPATERIWKADITNSLRVWTYTVWQEALHKSGNQPRKTTSSTSAFALQIGLLSATLLSM